jgi:signal transduction histidine kinase
VFSLLLAGSIAAAFERMLASMKLVSNGDLKSQATTTSSIYELNQLALSFNDMTEKLHKREESLRILNKSYLDLISFVSHELKGILSATIFNAYSVRDGFLGLVNFKQKKALDAIARNLDYFEATVKNFLNLSRIEKGEMALSLEDVLLKEEIFDPAVEDFVKPAAEKRITIINEIKPEIRLTGDVNLLRIVANNLVGNAVKYGCEGGKIIISCAISGGLVKVGVYNDGRPIASTDKDKLFKKFSRLKPSDDHRAQGTGLGLFITKEIVEKHGGKIWCEEAEHGNYFYVEMKNGRSS